MPIVFTTLYKSCIISAIYSDMEQSWKNLGMECLLLEQNTPTKNLLVEVRSVYFFMVYTWLKQVSRSHFVLSNAHISL